jgi:hypothetical protein
MKNGYYLSVYSYISTVATVINIGLRDNQNMSLWKKEGSKIELVHYWEFERSSGKKQHKFSFYDVNHAKKVINDLLGELNLSLDDMATVFGTPGLDTCQDYSSMDDYPDYTYHSITHLFSGLMMNTKVFYNENMIAIAADGGPDNVVDTEGRTKYFYSGIVSRKGKIEIFPMDSPGPLWVFMKYKYSMQEGSLMALGSASKSRYNLSVEDCYREMQDLKKMGDINLSYQWFERIAEKIEAVTEKDAGVLFNYFDDNFSIEENKISMIVKIIQEYSIMLMEKNVELLLRKGGLDAAETYLTVAGGYALNCPTNAYLMEKYHFKGFVAPPCVSDTGMSMGMALYYFSKNEKVDFYLNSASWGHEETDASINDLLNRAEYKKYIKGAVKAGTDQIVKDMIEQPIVWFNGRSEIGPRALGNRSIFADPRNPKHKDRLNEIKQRQWWRPVAPIVLEDKQEEWFENSYSSPFMLMAVNMKSEKVDQISAVAHLDNTARIQTINKEEAAVSDLYDIVSKFFAVTGVPMICNTSLNDKGEPIIDTAEEALVFALRKKIPVVYMNHIRIELQNIEQYEDNGPAQRSDAFECKLTEEEKKEKLEELNPYHLTREQLIVYLNNPELFVYDLKKEDDIKKLLRMFRFMPSLPFQ